MDVRELFGLGGAPFVVALVQICKAWVTDERWWPIVSIGWGLALNLTLARVLGTDYGVATILGILTGMVASGIYSNVKAPTKAAPEPPPHG